VTFRAAVAAATAAAFIFLPRVVQAQAFTPPQGVGSYTFAWQYVDNTGHRLTDGFLREAGQSVTTSLLNEIEYGVTDRLAVTAGIPFVFAKYSGALPPPSGLPVDECQCWHSSFQDFGFAVRYRFGDDFWAVTPTVRYDLPSHGYPYQGEAVVGKRLNELLVGLSVGRRLVSILPKTSVQASYTYAIVEQPLPDIPLNRSNAFFDIGYPLTRSLYIRGNASWQRTHGGLQAGSVTGDPFPLPGELNTPERQAQRDRLIRSNYWHAGGGMSYSFRSFDLFASFEKYVWGRDTHNGAAYTVGSTWYLAFPKANP